MVVPSRNFDCSLRLHFGLARRSFFPFGFGKPRGTGRKPKRIKSRSFFFLSPPQPLLLCTVNLQNFAALGLIAFFFLTFLLTGKRKEKKSKNKQIHKQKMEEGEEKRKKERKKIHDKIEKKILKSNFFPFIK